MIIYTKSVPDLDAKEFTACKRLNFGMSYGMKSKLIELRDLSRSKSRVTMAWDGEKLLGWALVFKDDYWHEHEWQVFIYVRAECRRKGIGTVLIGRTKMGRIKPIVVCPHDERSEAFFKPLIKKHKVKPHKFYD